MKKLLVSVLLLSGAAFSVSCNSVDEKTVSQIKNQVSQSFTDAQRGIEDLTPKAKSLTVDEVEKLFVFEYRVVDVDGEQSAEKLEALLNTLGRERWESYAVNPTSDGARIYLKRRPSTYLRYMPRIW